MVDLYYALYGTKRPFCLAQQDLAFLKPERVSPTFDRSYNRDSDIEHAHPVGHDPDLEWERERIREKDRLERERERLEREREKEREKEKEREREKKREKEKAAEKERESSKNLEFGVHVSL